MYLACVGRKSPRSTRAPYSWAILPTLGNMSWQNDGQIGPGSRFRSGRWRDLEGAVGRGGEREFREAVGPDKVRRTVPWPEQSGGPMWPGEQITGVEAATPAEIYSSESLVRERRKSGLWPTPPCEGDTPYRRSLRRATQGPQECRAPEATGPTYNAFQ